RPARSPTGPRKTTGTRDTGGAGRRARARPGPQEDVVQRDPRTTHRRAGTALALALAAALTACAGTDPHAGLLRSEADHVPVTVEDAPASAGAVAATENLGLLTLRSAPEPDENA